MALNIPNTMPIGESFGRSLTEGGNLFAQLMHPHLEREKQRQLEEHFKQELALKKQQLAQSGSLNGLRAKVLNSKLLANELKTNPQKALAFFQSIRQGLHPNQQSGQTLNTTPQENPMIGFNGTGMPALEEQQVQMPQENMQYGNAMQQPAEMQQSSGQSQESGIFGNLTPDEQVLLGMAGIKIPTVKENPKQKRYAELQNKIAFEKWKAKQEEKLPAAIKTLHENIIHLSPKAINAIQKIIDKPSPLEPWGFGAIQSGQKAAHNKTVTAAAENYSKSKGWPNTKGSIEKAESILQRGNFETDFDYRNRLRELQDELKEGIQSSNKFLHPNKQEYEENNHHNVIEYVRINGKLVPKK